MAYSIIDQIDNDLNWYFIDHYWHPCHVASGGGLMPDILINNDVNNDIVNSAVVDLVAGNFEIQRNENANAIIRARGVQDLQAYYQDFEYMARKGFFSFDKYDLNDPGDKRYFLVAFPTYISYNDYYPIQNRHINLIPRTRGTIRNNFVNPFNLINYFDKLR